MLREIRDGARPRHFDVICAGEAHWTFGTTPASMRLRPGGGAIDSAFALARGGLRVGLATALADDTFGRELLARVAATGVDTGAVTLVPPSTSLLCVDATSGTGQVVAYREEERPLEVPASWSSQVLLLSGLSPVVPYAAGLCRAARAARRAGTIVVVDVNARMHAWAGRDPKAIRMVLREADVVRCTAEDRAVLGLDAAAVRASLRDSAVLVSDEGTGTAWVTGPFGDIDLRRAASGGALTASICATLARAGKPGERSVEIWDRVLARGDAFASRG